MATMKAVRIHEFGGHDKLVFEDAPVPEPGPKDVRIRVRAAGVNPVDYKAREGAVEKLWPHTLPLILGWDVAGVVDAVGAEVTRFKAGDAVFGHIDTHRNGAYAEYTVVDEGAVAPLPKTLTFVEAAALPIAAETAWQALFEAAGLEAGQKVLVHAAAGGVGSFGVQFARWKGAHVIGTASARNHEYVRALGADEVIDYHAVRFEDVVKNVDVVFDTVGGDTLARSWQVLRPGGYLVGIVNDVPEEEAARRGVRGSWVLARPDSRDLAAIGDLVDSGAVKVTVSEVLPLFEAARAHEMIESGHTRGKIVLEVQ
jgi:NADPH:quinone reductase-like Zn-dependent oxidoreductase